LRRGLASPAAALILVLALGYLSLSQGLEQALWLAQLQTDAAEEVGLLWRYLALSSALALVDYVDRALLASGPEGIAEAVSALLGGPIRLALAYSLPPALEARAELTATSTDKNEVPSAPFSHPLLGYGEGGLNFLLQLHISIMDRALLVRKEGSLWLLVHHPAKVYAVLELCTRLRREALDLAQKGIAADRSFATGGLLGRLRTWNASAGWAYEVEARQKGALGLMLAQRSDLLCTAHGLLQQAPHEPRVDLPDRVLGHAAGGARLALREEPAPPPLPGQPHLGRIEQGSGQGPRAPALQPHGIQQAQQLERLAHELPLIAPRLQAFPPQRPGHGLQAQQRAGGAQHIVPYPQR